MADAYRQLIGVMPLAVFFRFGSVAASQHHIRRAAGLGGKADVGRWQGNIRKPGKSCHFGVVPRVCFQQGPIVACWVELGVFLVLFVVLVVSRQGSAGHEAL